MLRRNQIEAIQASVDNDFESGVHFHCTGSGKSWIAMNIVYQYHQKYPNNHILWICEKKSILVEQFSKDFIKSRNFKPFLSGFNVLNYAERKDPLWTVSVNSSVFWNKPVLLIINRAYLSSNDKYKLLKIKFGLIIHDECHSIANQSTQRFYRYLYDTYTTVKAIGFSATPNLDHNPFKKILSSYSIYDAFQDKIIVPPVIKWLTSQDILDDVTVLQCIKSIVDNELHYKKMVIWCGMIQLCFNLASLWSTVFTDYTICIDCSVSQNQYSDYTVFEKCEKNALLFCACKHREGSDIQNLDGCIFLDGVDTRCSRLFVQSLGRVLRLDKHNVKQKGLIIDVKARSSSYICSNINSYLQLPNHVFPWRYDYQCKTINKKLIRFNTLIMTDSQDLPVMIEKEITITPATDLKSKFIRTIPDDIKYQTRLNQELQLIIDKNLVEQLTRALCILDITKDIPHITRGSCGSSLICYLLGISHVDPVKYNIKFARFLTTHRNTLPDIDLDFPHQLREEVFMKIENMWPGKVARISNHVFYHEKSALRQAIRNAGIHQFIGKNDIRKHVATLDSHTQEFIKTETDRLTDTFRYHSLHCGGIVYYEDGVPQDLVLNNEHKRKHVIPQVYHNKHDISKHQNFKIDILSSRALSQLHEAVKYRDIQFENYFHDKPTFEMLSRGENLGITLAESPLMRKAFMKVKPNSMEDIAICLSLIRPAATDARNAFGENEGDDVQEHIIFDDDAIEMISNNFEISDDDADRYRRAFAKNDKDEIENFKNTVLKDCTVEQQRAYIRKLSNLASYGFCKSHAMSYAQLVYKLAYIKCHFPKRFWKSTLNNCDSYYKKWVHYYESYLAGVNVFQKCLKRDDVSIYAKNRQKKLTTMTQEEQLRAFGYWHIENDRFFPGCFYQENDNTCVSHFRGIIASVKIKNNKSTKRKNLMYFIGVDKQKYIQVNIYDVEFYNPRFIGIVGSGVFKNELDREYNILTCEDYKYF